MPKSIGRRVDILVVLLVSALAWSTLLFWHVPFTNAAHCAAMVEMYRTLPSSWFYSVTALACGSVLMVAAMMAPLLIGTLGHIWDRSFARRRFRSDLLFVFSYGIVWAAAAAALTALCGIIGAPPIRDPALALLIAAAFVWQYSPLKQRCLNRCHVKPPLAAFGVLADRDITRWGFTHGFWCVGSCWTLMLFPMLVSEIHVPAMAAMMLWMFGERLERPRPPGWHLIAPRRMVRILIAQIRSRIVAPVFRPAHGTVALPRVGAKLA